MTREELRKFEPLWDKWYIQEYLGGGSYGDVYRITCQVYESSYEAALKATGKIMQTNLMDFI